MCIRDRVYVDQEDIDAIKALDSTLYKTLKESTTGMSGRSADLTFNTPPMESFSDELNGFHEKLLDAKGPKYDFTVNYTDAPDWLGGLSWLLFPVLLLVFWIFIMRRMSGGGAGGGGGNIFSIGKSKATVFEKGKGTNTTFKDVAGLEGAK